MWCETGAACLQIRDEPPGLRLMHPSAARLFTSFRLLLRSRTWSSSEWLSLVTEVLKPVEVHTPRAQSAPGADVHLHNNCICTLARLPAEDHLHSHAQPQPHFASLWLQHCRLHDIDMAQEVVPPAASQSGHREAADMPPSSQLGEHAGLTSRSRR